MSGKPTRRLATKKAGTSSQSSSSANGAPATSRKDPTKPGARSKKTVGNGSTVNRLNRPKVLLLSGADIIAPGVSLDELDDELEDYYTAEQRRKDEEKQQKELNWKHKPKIENVRSMMLGYVEELEETDWMYEEIISGIFEYIHFVSSKGKAQPCQTRRRDFNVLERAIYHLHTFSQNGQNNSTHMYINPSDYKKTFDEIREISKSHSSCKVVIFVSCLDIDALCSAKIISALFKFDLIPHKIMPISGYQELKEKYSQLDDEISSMICLGCGGTVDLEAFFDIVSDEQDPNPDQLTGPRIYVIDNHRPWNLDNLFASSRVVCFDDGGIDRALAEHKEAYMVLQELGEEDDEDSDLENDGDTDGDDEYPSSTYSRDVSDLHTPSSSPGRRHSKSPLVNANVITSDNEDNTDNDEDDDDNDIYYKRHKSDSPSSQKENINPERLEQVKAKAATRELRAMRAKHQALLEEYYMQGTYFHESISSEVYRLVSLIGETNITNLWLMVIGVTSLDVQHSTIYTELFPLLKEEVLRQCPPAQTTSAATNQQLLIQEDYLLFLLRHWSLYQSVLHSSYLSAKLHLWTDDGRKKLHKMLAKMGISLHEAKEHYALMNVDLKRSLASKLKGVAAMYGIEKVFRQGIARRYGYKGTITAGDAVDALAALLEAGADKKGFKSKETDSQDSADKGKFWISNFWDAWDALDNFDLLVAGMHKAKALQSVVVSSSTALFEKRLIKDLRSYRLAVIREGPDLDLFKNPLALARLGAWIGEACSESHSQPLPLVVASFDKDTNSYMVLGMGPRKSRDVELDPNSTVYNRFGPAFQATSERINAQLTFDAFESSIIQVSKDDLSRFLENLTLTGLLEN